MEYNILDRVLDEDEYGPYSAEMRLRGLSKAGQKALIHDTAKKLERKARNAGVQFDGGLYESRLNNMPEKIQDAILYTNLKAPITFKSRLFDPKSSNYNNEKHTIEINENVGLVPDVENALFHESAHWMDHANGRKAKIKNLIDNDIEERRISGLGDKNIGGVFRSELIDADEINGKKISPYEYVNGFIDNDYEKHSDIINETLLGSDIDNELMLYLNRELDDWYNLHPDVIATSKTSHGNNYKRRLQNLAALSGIDDYETIRNYPLSIESVAEIVPGLGYNGGEYYFRKYSPKTLGMIEDHFSSYPGLNRFIPPHRKYADEEGLRLIDERERKLNERRARANERYNVKFMSLPEDKRNYYENAKTGDVLWVRDPMFKDDRYWILKGDPEYVFQGDRLKKFNRGMIRPGQFDKHGSYYTDLNWLSPEDANTPMSDFERDFTEHDRRKLLKKLDKRRNK